jgi:hypothetical protein
MACEWHAGDTVLLVIDTSGVLCTQATSNVNICGVSKKRATTNSF